jgi:hypothetical protein
MVPENLNFCGRAADARRPREVKEAMTKRGKHYEDARKKVDREKKI